MGMINIFKSRGSEKSSEESYKHSIEKENAREKMSNAKGLQSLMKAFIGREKYSWQFHEDLLVVIEVNEMMCEMC